MTYRKKVAQKRVSRVFTAVAPLGGLNDIDPLATMEEQYCIQLNNWIPGNNSLQARQGYREWTTNLGLPVRTIMPYLHMNGDTFTFAATDTDIYDVTWQYDAPVSYYSGLTNGKFNYTIFGNVANQYLVAVNGLNPSSLFYDGIAWQPFVEADTPVAPGEIKGVDPGTWSHVTAFKRRLWFVEKDSMTAWYLPIDAIAGEAKPFYLTSVFKRGGKLLYMIDWTVDGGDGLDNKLIFVSNLGEVAVYAGDNPDLTESWGLQAVFFASAPMGDRSFVEFGGDVFMTTTLGVIPLSAILTGLMNRTPVAQTITKKINKRLNRLINERTYDRNWELHNLPALQAVALIIPPVGEAPAIQFVMNSSTGAWAQLDMPINTGALVYGEFHFGTVGGTVMKFGGGNYLDNVKLDGKGGDPVICSLFSAYSYMGDPATLKHWKLIRPLFQSDQPPSFLLTLNVDYDTAALAGNPQPPGDDQDDPLWDTAIWDQAFWSSSFTTFRPWIGVSAMGTCCALLLKAATNDATTLVAIEYVYEPGGVV